MDAEKVRVSREKLTRVFRYLEALNQHRNPAKQVDENNETSPRTALRDIEELIAAGVIEREEAGGRSTSYRLRAFRFTLEHQQGG